MALSAGWFPQCTMAAWKASYNVFFALVGVSDLIRVRRLFFFYIFVFETALTVNEAVLKGKVRQMTRQRNQIKCYFWMSQLVYVMMLMMGNETRIISGGSEAAFAHTGTSWNLTSRTFEIKLDVAGMNILFCVCVSAEVQVPG